MPARSMKIDWVLYYRCIENVVAIRHTDHVLDSETTVFARTWLLLGSIGRLSWAWRARQSWKFESNGHWEKKSKCQHLWIHDSRKIPARRNEHREDGFPCSNVSTVVMWNKGRNQMTGRSRSTKPFLLSSD